MSVLAREQDSYRRALEAYQRQINQYNRNVDKYKTTLVKDANGNLLVVDGGDGLHAVNSGGQLIAPSLPSGFNPEIYGRTPIPGGQGYLQLRQGPLEKKVETRTGLRQYSDESGTYYMDADWNLFRPGPFSGWKVEQTSGGDDYSPALYTATRDSSAYMAAPAEWTKTFDRKAPSATTAQLNKVDAPTLAAVEGGLVGEVMKGKGVRYGVPVYRPKGDA